MKILIADDEHDILKALKAFFEHNKYTVDTVDNGEDAVVYIQEGAYDCLILDIMMPGKDGLQVLREIRAQGSAIPVLLLSARGELNDRVKGLDAGADDYLPKPFDTIELLARVKALMRRSNSFVTEIISMGCLKLNCTAYELSTPDGLIKMNNKEFQMIEQFIRNPQKVFSTEELKEKIWGWDSDAEINVVWTNIANLRRKLEQLKADVEIRSVRGVGYQLAVKE